MCVYAGFVPERPDSPKPARLAWDEAPGVILSRVGTRTGPAVVCIAGAVGAGKSALARRIAETTDALRIATDDYLPDYDRTPDHLRDEPDAAHLPELAGHLAELFAGRPVDLPVWSFHEHRRTGVRRATPRSLIIVEGIHALHHALSDARTLGVLVEASAAVRWARWEILESTGQRGWGVEKARDFFESVADPTFERHRPAYHARADYLVTNDAGLPAR